MEAVKIAEDVLLIGGYYEDEHGDIAISLFLVSADSEKSAIEKLYDNGIHKQRCCHEYDCCGNLYGNHPRIIEHKTLGNDKTFLVEWAQHRNV